MTCAAGDAAWSDPDRCAAEVVRDLEAAGIARAAEVRAVHVERVADTYPVYDLGYRAELRRALSALGRWQNVVAAGRCGRFWYNNMDHCIAHGRRLGEVLGRGGDVDDAALGPREFWREPASRAG